MDTYGTYWIFAKDKAGNVTSKSVVAKIDDSAPTADNINIDVAKGGGEWSEFASVTVSFDWDGKSPITCTVKDGTTELASQVFNGKSSSLADGWTFLESTNKLVYKTSVIKNTSLTATMSDAAHPADLDIASKSLDITGVDGTPLPNPEIAISPEGWGQEKTVAVNFGTFDNSSPMTCTVRMDEETYTATISNENGLTAGTGSEGLFSYDAATGAIRFEKTVTSGYGSITAAAEDEAGHSAESLEIYSVTQIDTTDVVAPQIDISDKDDWKQEKTFTVNFGQFDGLSPMTCTVAYGTETSTVTVADGTVSGDGWSINESGEIVFTYTADINNLELRATVSDEAGHELESAVTDIVEKIDTIDLGNITVSYEPEEWAQSKNLTINFGSFDGLSPMTCEVTLGNAGKESVTISSANQALSGNWSWRDGELVYTATVNVNDTALTVASSDEAGHSQTFNGTVSKIDTESPAIPTIEVSNTEYTNQSVNVVIRSKNSDGGSPLTSEYSIDGGANWISWDGNEKTLKISENCVIIARTKDEVFGWQENRVDISNIVTTELPVPTLVASTSEQTNQNVIITVNGVPASNNGAPVTTYYRLNENDAWTVLNGTTLVVDKNCTVEVYCKDAAGNETAPVTKDVSNIDKVAPEIPRITATPGTLTNQNVIVTITFAETVNNYYSRDGKEFKLADGEKQVSFECEKNEVVKAWSIDAASNVSQTEEYRIDYIDKVAPAVPVIMRSTEAPTNQDVYVTVNFASDAVRRQYAIDGGKWIDYSGPIRMQRNGSIKVRCADAAGNESSAEYQVRNIDKTAPEQPKVSASTTEKTNQTVTLTPSFAADSTKNEYSLDGQNWMAYTAPIILAANATVLFRSTDAAGNSSVTSFPVTNIYPDPDNTQPAVNPHNNSKDTPSSVAPTLYGEVSLRSTLSPEDNVDAYNFTGNQIGSLTLSMSELAFGAKVRVTIYADNKKMKTVTLKGNGTNIFKLPVVGSTVVVENMTKGKKYVATDYALNIKGDFFPDPTTNDNSIYETQASFQVDDAGHGTSDTGWVGIRDAVDCYRVNMKNAGMLTLNVYEVSAKLKVTLYDYDGKKIKSKTISGSANNIFGKEQLVKNSFCFIQVESGDKGKGKQNSSYRLEVNQNYFPMATNDNSFDTANQVRTAGTGTIGSGWVGVNDSIDFYKLNFFDSAGNASQMGTLNFSIRDVSAKLKVTLYDVYGNVIKSTSVSKNKDNLFKPQTLNGGAAYLSVESGDKGKGKQNSYYTLDVQGTIYPPAVEYNRTGMLA